MSKKRDFNPMDHDRPPRQEGYKEETHHICQILMNRGDQRIGQLLLNAIRGETSTEPPKNPDDIEEIYEARKEIRAEEWNYLWNIEAPELLEKLEKLDVHRSR